MVLVAFLWWRGYGRRNKNYQAACLQFWRLQILKDDVYICMIMDDNRIYYLRWICCKEQQYSGTNQDTLITLDLHIDWLTQTHHLTHTSGTKRGSAEIETQQQWTVGEAMHACMAIMTSSRTQRINPSHLLHSYNTYKVINDTCSIKSITHTIISIGVSTTHSL